MIAGVFVRGVGVDGMGAVGRENAGIFTGWKGIIHWEDAKGAKGWKRIHRREDGKGGRGPVTMSRAARHIGFVPTGRRGGEWKLVAGSVRDNRGVSRKGRDVIPELWGPVTMSRAARQFGFVPTGRRGGGS